ncbi:MAG: hypothetical protein L6R41_007040 [Letrouitia leprolyta]|nr:MAG: hypothetical protein L6R41_007040 [Letrouitia leprolyta]
MQPPPRTPMAPATAAYTFSSLARSTAISINSVKKGKFTKKIARLEARRALGEIVYGKHVGEVPSSSSQGVLYFAAVVIGPLGATYVTTDVAAPAIATAQEPSAKENADPSATKVAEDSAYAPSDTSDVKYPIKDILDEGVNSDGGIIYFIDWEGN